MKSLLKLLGLLVLLGAIIGHTIPTTAQDNAEYPVITAENADQLEEIAVWGRGTIHDVEWSPKDDWIAVGGSRGVWLLDAHDLTAEPILLEGHTDVVMMVAFHPDGEFLASASRDGTVRIWDLATFEIVHIFEDANGRALDISPDGKYLAYSGKDSEDWREYIRVIEWETWQEIWTDIGVEDTVTSLSFSSDSKILYVGSRWLGDAPNWILEGIFIEETEIPQTGVIENEPVYNLAYSLLATEDTNFSASLTADRLIVASPDGKWIAAQVDVPSTDWYFPSLSLINRETETVHLNLPTVTTAMSFSADSSMLVTLNSSSLDFWDVATGELKFTYEGFTQRIREVRFVDGQEWLAIRTATHLLIYNLTEQRIILNQPATAYQFTPDGQWLLIANETRLEWRPMENIWQVQYVAERFPPIDLIYTIPDTTQLLTATVIQDPLNSTQYEWHLWEEGGSPFSYRDVATGDILDENLGIPSPAYPEDVFRGKPASQATTGSQNIRVWQNYIFFYNETDVLTEDKYRTYNAFALNTETWQIELLASNTLTLFGHLAIDEQGKWLAHGSGNLCNSYHGDPPDLNVYEIGEQEPTIIFAEYKFPSEYDYSDLISNCLLDMVFSPDGQLLVTAEGDEFSLEYPSFDHHFQIWSIKSQERVIRYAKSHNRPVTTVDFSPDGRLLATGSADGTVRLWAVQEK